jgi:hypothetical protein
MPEKIKPIEPIDFNPENWPEGTEHREIDKDRELVKLPDTDITGPYDGLAKTLKGINTDYEARNEIAKKTMQAKSHALQKKGSSHPIEHGGSSSIDPDKAGMKSRGWSGKKSRPKSLSYEDMQLKRHVDNKRKDRRQHKDESKYATEISF